jgi:hypothetical protein
MPGVKTLRVVIVKPSKYAADGWVERFRWGFMPNATVRYLAGLTPRRLGDIDCSVERSTNTSRRISSTQSLRLSSADEELNRTARLARER